MTTEPITARQVSILRHALGWPTRYRNHFVTGEGSDDFADCEALAAAGMMVKFKRDWICDSCYVVTEAGIDAACAAP